MSVEKKNVLKKKLYITSCLTVVKEQASNCSYRRSGDKRIRLICAVFITGIWTWLPVYSTAILPLEISLNRIFFYDQLRMQWELWSENPSKTLLWSNYRYQARKIWFFSLFPTFLTKLYEIIGIPI